MSRTRCSALALLRRAGTHTTAELGPGSASQHCMLRRARDTRTPMLNFLGKRILQLIPTLFFVSVLIFSLQHLLPGDPALVMAGEEKDPAVIAQIREHYR